MAKNIHKGTELNNIKETWEQNERARRENSEIRNTEAPDDDLTKVVKEEAAEYDNMNNDERLLGGERASVNDADNKE